MTGDEMIAISEALRELYREREILWIQFNSITDPYDLDVIIMRLRANEHATQRLRGELHDSLV